MGLRDTFLNMLDKGNVKQDNSALRSARDFLINGNRGDRLYPTWSEIKMSDSDMYSGYAYAVIQKRGNKVASLAQNNLRTLANKEIVDEFQKKDEAVVHPYLKLIEESTDFTEKQFWKNISIYLDLAGRYYLGVVRGRVNPVNPELPSITTDPTKFIMLNPYEIRRVVDKNKRVAGYIERKKDGRYREWPVHQIIEFRELDPFDPENGHWAMTDAAKDAVYTINQSGDYTRQSLNGNIDAPGIITTDVLLNDNDFANFRARVTQHKKGEPLFGNGTGAIKWDSMQIDLDKAALLDINEINRTTLFAVSGTSKTSLGIEQSGTTRETARVQSEQFISDTAQPRLEDIVGFLNLDYKRYYAREFKQTGYKIEVQSAVGKDYDTDQKAVQLKQSQFQLAMTLMQSGYTTESAWQFAEGSIDYEDLELEKGLDKPKNPGEGNDEEGANENAPTSPNNGPQSGSGSGDDTDSVSENKSSQNVNNDLNELEPHADLIENGGKGSGNFGHAGRPGKRGGSGKGGIVIDKEYEFNGEKMRAVTMYLPEEKKTLIQGTGRDSEKPEEWADYYGYLDGNPSDKEIGNALYYGKIKALDRDTAYRLADKLDELDKVYDPLEDRPRFNSMEGEKCGPLEVLEVDEPCTCEHDHKVETLINEVQEDNGKVVKNAYDEFLGEIRAIEKETINACARKISVNAFEESDLIGKKKKETLTEKLKNALHKYWWVIFPLLANNSMAKRNKQFGKDAKFVFNNDLQKGVDDNAKRVAEGHMETILGDILEASNKAYTQVTEEAAAELIIKAYKVNPEKYEDYFDHEPTMADALSSIRKTDILEKNRRIYEKANKMAFEGYDRRTIIKAIRNEYKDISEKRATLIAKNETSRAFGRSQYEADKQFLNSIGKLDQAYKRWVSRRPPTEQDKICAFCQALIDKGPIPFDEPFLEYGNSMEVVEGDKVKIYTANYESIESSVLHVGCMCHYELVFKNAQGEFVKTLNEGEKEVENAARNTLDNNSSDSGDSSSRDNATPTEDRQINGRMDVNGRVHDNLGQFMSKAGFTSKPSIITAIEVAEDKTNIGEQDGQGNQEASETGQDSGV